jgi:hypothetical protein
MLYDEAKQRILVHAGFALSDEEIGFLGRLRPYSGIREKDFADLVECLVSIYPAVSKEPRVDRELCAALWSLCERTRILTHERHGTLRTNKLATAAELDRLTAWTDAIEVFAIRMLCGLDLGQCLSHVAEHLSKANVEDPANFRFLLPVLDDLRRDEDEEVREAATDALRALGDRR